MYSNRRGLLRRGLEFHVCSINKSAHTKKIWKLIEGTSYQLYFVLLECSQNAWKTAYEILMWIFFYLLNSQMSRFIYFMCVLSIKVLIRKSLETFWTTLVVFRDLELLFFINYINTKKKLINTKCFLVNLNRRPSRTIQNVFLFDLTFTFQLEISWFHRHHGNAANSVNEYWFTFDS